MRTRGLTPRARPIRAAVQSLTLVIFTSGTLVASVEEAIPPSNAGACFTDIDADLPGVHTGAVVWGDYDNDGDLDLLVTGVSTGGPISRVYRNSGGPNPTFTDILTGLPGVSDGGVAWADFNNDGYLDILLAGTITKVYMNSGGPNPLFTDLLAPLPAVFDGAVAVGDYENDGDLDFVLTGDTGSGSIARVYRNNGAAQPVFTDIAAGFPGLEMSVASWADTDNDRDLDLMLAGRSDSGLTSFLYKNDGGVNPTFSNPGWTLGAALNGSASWGDYDNDGDLDLACTGGESSSSGTAVFLNHGPPDGFLDVHQVGLPGVQRGTVAWGDYDNDGDLDLLLVGFNGAAASARVLAHSGDEFPSFTDIGAGLPGVGRPLGLLRIGSSAAWGDYDSDGRLDIVIAGQMNDGTNITRIFRNTCGSGNTPPLAPTNLHMTVSGSRAVFTWDAATDAETPLLGLSYNLRIGTAPGLADVVTPMASPATGYRRVVALGNTNQSQSWETELPASGSYYWSVQAVDGAFAGSPWGTERSTTTNVDERAAPLGYSLQSDGPNPFSSTTSFQFSQGKGEWVSLGVYDTRGRRVRMLADEVLPMGQHKRSWDGRDDKGQLLPAGVYMVRMKTANVVRSTKISLRR